MRDALDLLERILARKDKADRLTECLRTPEQEYTKDWHACLPKCFNAALDIKRTVLRHALRWTQGAAFAFKQGDVIYDKREGYLDWNQALLNINFCLQVTGGMDAGPSSDGRVDFTVYKPNKDRTKLVAESYETMTQAEFIRFLISGGK